jgi:hypothetical protein
MVLRRQRARVGFFDPPEELMLAPSLEVEEPLVVTPHLLFLHGVGFRSFDVLLIILLTGSEGDPRSGHHETARIPS